MDVRILRAALAQIERQRDMLEPLVQECAAAVGVASLLGGLAELLEHAAAAPLHLDALLAPRQQRRRRLVLLSVIELVRLGKDGALRGEPCLIGRPRPPRL